MKRLVQIQHAQYGRRVAVAQDETLQLVNTHTSIYALAGQALSTKRSLADVTEELLSTEYLEYDSIYLGKSEWRLLPSFDHPSEPSRCLVSGTGLTHKPSVESRQDMHDQSEDRSQITDSMRMYQWGLEGGYPGSGKIGVQPEWFYKGLGHIVRAHGAALDVPPYAKDGGEEPEVAGAYIIDTDGCPCRVGFTIANEFSDHVMEKMNYLYLAPSKLRSCAIGPELVINFDFSNVSGTVHIERDGKTIWSKSIATGEANMCHSLANLEHHHFKYDVHRRPGDAHIHFFGADAFSFGDDIALSDGDVLEIAWHGLGRPLRNPIRIDRSEPSLVRVRVLH